MIRALLVLLVIASTSVAQEPRSQRPARRGESAGYSSRDATVLSMMGWGFGLGIGIATLCALMTDSTSSSSH